jgi:hypothetical protein
VKNRGEVRNILEGCAEYSAETEKGGQWAAFFVGI